MSKNQVDLLFSVTLCITNFKIKKLIKIVNLSYIKVVI